MKFSLLKIAFMLALICMPAGVRAQDKGKSELSFGAGMMASENAASDAGTLWISAIFNQPKDVRIVSAAWSVAYKYHVSERLAIGGTTVYNPVSDRWIPDMFGSDRWKRRSLTTAGEATLYWVKSRDFQFYGTAGVGFFVKRSSFYDTQFETDLGGTFQVSPVGLRIGNKVGVFMELGFGYRGVFNGGLSWRF
ncbi:hypothetical protein GCM10010967_49330 [Dyadobacter beijingensis]|uniref:Outer membrane protein beta-barrel domain-containing protein n=1 Tax=Dyadobacter beijingensis TaxID=365489 RepID=A0ABQ2IIK7_9BACT|nr:hypothetical protein [Dyadobacter beijingensis]GGN07829.1 hypothetical protein GCM10010967_49330 [Dyadobacter beijingensis]